MLNIDNYNSSYPLAYYDIGTVYSFYGQSSQKGKPATELQIRKYSAVLNQLNEKKASSAIKPVGAAQAEEKEKLNRFYAVVVDKVRLSGKAFIVVMFCNVYAGKTEYLTKYYAVNTDCITNDKNLMPVSSHLTFETEHQKISKGRAGGITLAGKESNVGGITRTGHKESAPVSVGGITRAGNTHIASNTHPTGKVGGITLAKGNRVGGITRVKK